MNVAFLLNYLESNRYGKIILPENVDCIYVEDPFSWIGLIKFRRRIIDHLFVFGSRPVDIACLKCLGPFSKKVIILQHASNPKRYLNEVPLNFLLANAWKLTVWTLFIAVCRFLSYGKISNVVLFYYSEFYLQEWTTILKGIPFSSYKCPSPNVLTYGSQHSIKVCVDAVKFQLIDEPFPSTLGITESDEKNLLLDILNATSPHLVYVKVHPRSDPSKYKCSKRFIISSYLYDNADVVVGYRSGLLKFPFKSNKRLLINKNLKGGLELNPRNLSKSSISNPILDICYELYVKKHVSR